MDSGGPSEQMDSRTPRTQHPFPPGGQTHAPLLKQTVSLNYMPLTPSASRSPDSDTLEPSSPLDESFQEPDYSGHSGSGHAPSMGSGGNSNSGHRGSEACAVMGLQGLMGI